jgi:molecular chaperone DnaJ
MNGSRAWFEKDFYKVLGVGENASADELKRAFKKLAREHHPDRNPGNSEAEERMKDISEAHEVLSDPKKREEYDQIRRMSRSGYAPGGGGRQGNVRFEEGIPFDLGDLFGGVFGGGRRGSAREARRGPDLETSVRLSFEDAARGATVPVRVKRDAPCSACGGSGDRSGLAHPCPTCGGSGMTAESQGMFSFARTCPTCGGSGRHVQDPCPVCRATGIEHRTETVKVKIPAGISDGARIRVRNRGGAVAGGQTGDLYVIVHVERDPVFGRAGADLTVDVPVSYSEAVLGTKVTVPTLEEPVTVKIPAGTESGKVFRVRGRGIAKPKGGRGDLLATVRVHVPKKVSKEERGLLEKLAELDGDAAKERARSPVSGNQASGVE